MALGRKTGGRAPGARNKATAAKAAAIKASGLTPLDFMMEVMRNQDYPMEARLDAAKAAAPYVHPRLANINAHVSGTVTLESLIAASLEDVRDVKVT